MKAIINRQLTPDQSPSCIHLEPRLPHEVDNCEWLLENHPKVVQGCGRDVESGQLQHLQVSLRRKTSFSDINLEEGEEITISRLKSSDSIFVTYSDSESGESRSGEIFAGAWIKDMDGSIVVMATELQQRLRKGLP